MKEILFKSVFLLVFVFFIASCEKTGKLDTQVKTLNVYVDESLYDLMKAPLMIYDTVFAGSEVKLTKATAAESMAQLLAGKCDAIISSRSYTKKEDSLMKVYQVQPHVKETIAKDALIFYVDMDFPLDTITSDQLVSLLTDKNSKLSAYFKNIKSEPVFVCNNFQSSEFYNLKEMVLKNKKIEKYIKFYNSHDSVMSHILKNKNDIGIGYLSHITHNGEYKALSVSFTDSTGKYINRKPVHQAYLIQGMYPYIINHQVLVADAKDFDFQGAFLRFISKNGQVQRYFNEFGIVPAFAKVRIIDNN
jgi:hypothetical protein